MRASRSLLWKLSIIVLLAVFSQPSFSGDTGSSDETETGNGHEAAEMQPQRAGNRKGRGGRGGIAQVAEMNWPGKWELFLKSSGVSAMHAILLPLINKVQFYDATIWRISQIKLPPGVPCHVFDHVHNKVDCWAHSVLIDIESGHIRPLSVTNYCLLLLLLLV